MKAICLNCWDSLYDHSTFVGHCTARRTTKGKQQIPGGPTEYRYVECGCDKFELVWVQDIDDLLPDKQKLH